MSERHTSGKGIFSMWKMFCVLFMLGFFSGTATAAGVISGMALNGSRSQPAAGDDVILLRLDQGMQEEARVKTDAQGRFSFSVQYPDKAYLVRVVHDGVNYDQQASSGDNLAIDVFDATRQVRGVSGSIEILRTGTNGKLLHVSDMYEIRNGSNPPLTQAGDHTFEVYLPAAAKIDSVLAAGPGKIGEMISAAPVPGEPGHYVVNFPLRPGATKFAFNYDLPYDGHAVVHTRHEYPLQQMAVMVPTAMKFSSRSKEFQILPAGNDKYQVQAVNQLKAGEGPTFEVSGMGALPTLGEEAKSQVTSPIQVASNTRVSPPGRVDAHTVASGVLSSGQTQRPSQLLALVGMSVVFIAASGFLVWRRHATRQSRLYRSS